MFNLVKGKLLEFFFILSIWKVKEDNPLWHSLQLVFTFKQIYSPNFPRPCAKLYSNISQWNFGIWIIKQLKNHSTLEYNSMIQIYLLLSCLCLYTVFFLLEVWRTCIPRISFTVTWSLQTCCCLMKYVQEPNALGSHLSGSVDDKCFKRMAKSRVFPSKTY